MRYNEMTKEQKLACVEQIKRLEALLPEYDIYIHYGTLLGSVREQGLIGHDTDIDVAYISKYHKPEEVEAEMIDIYRRLLDAGVLDIYWKQERTPEWFVAETSPTYDIQEPVGQAHIVFDDPEQPIDLYTTWIDEKGDYYNPLEPTAWCKGKDLYPFKKGSLEGLEFNIPNNSESLLEHHYGDWRTPRDEKPQCEYYSAIKKLKEEYVNTI